MTAPNPAELTRLDAAATPGEWRWRDNSIETVEQATFVASLMGRMSQPTGPADAALIVYLRNHTADFLAAMEERDRLAAENADLRIILLNCEIAARFRSNPDSTMASTAAGRLAYIAKQIAAAPGRPEGEAK